MCVQEFFDQVAPDDVQHLAEHIGAGNQRQEEGGDFKKDHGRVTRIMPALTRSRRRPSSSGMAVLQALTMAISREATPRASLWR